MSADDHMQLNNVPPGHSKPGRADLSHHSTPKQKAEFHIRNTLGPDTVKAGNKADEDTGAVTGGGNAPGPAALKGWQTKTGLEYVFRTWETQVKKLSKQLGSEADALRNTNNLFDDNETFTKSKFKSDNSKPRSPIYDHI